MISVIFLKMGKLSHFRISSFQVVDAWRILHFNRKTEKHFQEFIWFFFCPSTYSGFEIWVLRFPIRVLDVSFWSLGCSSFEIWVLRFRVLGASFSRFGCFVLRSSFSKLPCLLYQIAFRDCTFNSAPQRPFLVSSGGKGEKKERSVWWTGGKRERERGIFPCSHRPPRAYFYLLLQDQGVPLRRRECRHKKLSGVWTKP